MKRSHRQLFLSHVSRIAVRSLAATLILWILISFPFPFVRPQYFFLVQVPLSVFLFVVYIGKLLFDTFFYDHYGQ